MLDVPDGKAEVQAREFGVSGDFSERLGERGGLRVGGERVDCAALRKRIAKGVCAVGQSGRVAREEGDGHVAVRGVGERASDADSLDIENVLAIFVDQWCTFGG